MVARPLGKWGSSPAPARFWEHNIMATKIQINSLPALEALLASDPDFEVEFRKAVIAEYEKKHILPTIEKRVKELVGAAVHEQLGGVDYHNRPNVRDDFVEEVNRVVGVSIAGMVEQAVEDAIGIHLTPEVLASRIDEAVEARLIWTLREELDAKVKKAIKVLKEK